MTQEDKQLLLRDLCARLAFGRVKCQVKVESFNEEMDDYIEFFDDEIVFIEPRIYNVYLYEEGTDVDISDIKPYLRPMSSMTEEERKELSYYENSVQITDFYYSHHIDCRFMIEKGLALEAKEGMYKTK